MFQKVAKLKHGGNPYIDHETGQIIPSVTGVPGGMNAVNTSIYQTGQAVQPSALGDTKITGILGGMNEFYPIANDFADALYPQKTPEEYAAEAAQLYQTDYSAEREAIETQKDVAIKVNKIPDIFGGTN